MTRVRWIILRGMHRRYLIVRLNTVVDLNRAYCDGIDRRHNENLEYLKTIVNIRVSVILARFQLRF